MHRHELAEVDSAELKFIVPQGEERVALEALGLDLRTAEVQQVYYVDTPDLALRSRGLVLRVRRRQGGDQDTAVKLRPAVPAELPHAWRAGAGCTVELDVVPGMSVRTATAKRVCRPGALDAALTGERPLRELFSKRQQALVSRSGPDKIDWPSLRAFGPVDVSKVTIAARQHGRQLVVQRWGYPDGSSLLELSMRVRPRDLHKQSIRFWTFLAELGFDVAAEQETKSTRTLALLARLDGARMPRSTR
jgi:hypothetical protein